LGRVTQADGLVPQGGIGRPLGAQQLEELNPVRKGLVKRPEDERRSSYNNSALDQEENRKDHEARRGRTILDSKFYAHSSNVAFPRDEMPRKSGTLAGHEVLSILWCKFFLRGLSSQGQQSRFDQFVNIQVSAARKSESVPGGGV
jgi:hypothetical protein